MPRLRRRSAGSAPAPEKSAAEPPPPRKLDRPMKPAPQNRPSYQHQVAVLLAQSVW